MANDTTSRALATQALLSAAPSIEQFGAQSSTVVAPYVNTAAFLSAFATGPAKIALNGDFFPVAAIAISEPVHLHWTGQQPAILLPKELKLLDGCGATLSLTNSRGVIGAPYASYDYPEIRSDLAADVAAGDTTLTLAPGEGVKWSAGDAFLYRLGSLPFDLPEPLQWGFGKVRSVVGDVLTIDAPMPAPFVIASVASQPFTDSFGNTGRTNKTIYQWPLMTDLTIRNLTIASDPQAAVEGGLDVVGAQRVVISAVAVRSVGAGIGFQYVDGALIDACSMTDSTTPTNPNLNKGIGLAESRNVEIRQFTCSGTKFAVAAEANSQATVIGGHFHNTGNPANGASYGSQCMVFTALGLSQLTVRDFTITGYGGYILAEVANGVAGFDGQIRFEGRLTLIHDTIPVGFGRLADLDCVLDMRIAGAREVWDFPGARWVKRRIMLRGGLSENLLLPPGILRQIRIYSSQGIVPGTSLTGFYVGRSSDNGTNYVSQLVAGQTVTLKNADGGAVFDRRSEQLKLLIATATGTALDAGAEFLDVDCQIVPNLLAPAFAWSNEDDARMIGPGGELREALFAGYDLSPIAAGATLQVDFAIPQMALGDFIASVSLGTDRAGLSVRDAQCLPGICRTVFENRTAAAIDLAAANLRILWSKSPRG
jgi:hypothetical protein